MPKSKYPSQITSLKTINNEIMVGLNNGTIHTKNFSFTAHEKEFDTLESTDIPEKINDFFWVDSGSFYHKFISCNDKFIGVNKVRENNCANDIIYNIINRNNTNYMGKPVKLIKNAHHYNIESLSSYQDYFISTDYLRINMWNIHNLTKCYNLLDCKPSRFEEMEYIITKGTLQNNLFSYSTSNGEIFLNDLRIKNNRQLRIELPKRDDLYEEILRMVHDYIILDDKLVARDMNSVHFFDLRTNSHIKSIILTKYTNEYLENQFTSNTFGNYKLTNQNNNFYTGSKDGMVYKIDWEYNLYSYDLNLKEDVELISVNDEKVYCGIKECLYEILKDSFIL